MKAVFKSLGLVLAGGLVFQVPQARANFEVSAGTSIGAVSDFYTPLEAQGGWVTVGSYGRCWRPNGVAADWRPYCTGEWVWTDCGWYWQSEEPWAWACYHYGNWVYEPALGWCWVPGIEWAPAWVSWRIGSGYIGWAPLGPRGVIYAGPQFVFVENARFGRPVRRSDVVINNTVIINKTKVVNNVRQETRVVGGSKRTVVVNEGPGVTQVQKASGRTIEKRSIQQVAQSSPAPSAFAHQNSPRTATFKNDNVKSQNVTPQVEQNNPQSETVTTKPELRPATPDQPRSPWHPNRPGDNREPTTRWWTPSKKSQPVENPPKAPAAPPTIKHNEVQRPVVTPAPKGPAAPSPAQPQPQAQPRSEPEHREKP